LEAFTNNGLVLLYNRSKYINIVINENSGSFESFLMHWSNAGIVDFVRIRI